MNVELRAIKANESEDVYLMFQEIPAEEDGFYNDAYGLTREEFEFFCIEETNHSLGINLPTGHVPASGYILLIDEHPVGYVKLRHFLNDYLRQGGGHIGYSIRPSCRGNGWGNLILAEVLKFAKIQGIEKALLTIRDYNVRSRKVCEYNGGVLEKIVPADGYSRCFYWIEIK